MLMLEMTRPTAFVANTTFGQTRFIDCCAAGESKKDNTVNFG